MIDETKIKNNYLKGFFILYKYRKDINITGEEDRVHFGPIDKKLISKGDKIRLGKLRFFHHSFADNYYTVWS